jgi:hypothetical protein
MVVQRGEWEVCAIGIPRRLQASCDRASTRRSRDGHGQRDLVDPPCAPAPRDAYAPAPVETPRYDYYPRHDERLYQADVVAVRAVGGPPSSAAGSSGERVSGYNSNNVAGAVVGGILGGVLGPPDRRRSRDRTSRRRSAPSAGRPSAPTSRAARLRQPGRAPLRDGVVDGSRRTTT